MASSNRNIISNTFGIDVSALFRAVIRNLLLISVCSVAIGTIVYMGITRFVPREYSITSSVVVVSKDNTVQNLRSYRYTQAISQYAGILNNDIYREVIQNNLDNNISITSENLQATALENSNLIILKVTHQNPEYAFRILKQAVNSYADVESYAMTGYTLRTLSEPSVDRIQIESNNALLIAIAIGILIVIVGMGLSMLFHLVNGKLDNETQAINKLDANFLGSIPYTKKSTNNNMIYLESEMKFDYKFALKKISNAIENSASKQNYKTILISSVFENEGKSTVVANISIALGKMGKKVLILDMDLRKPALYKVLEYDIPATKEITQGLIKMTPYENLITYDSKRGISYIAGTISLDGSEITTCIVNLKTLLAQVSPAFDYIVIDSPPMALAQDAELMGEEIDAMVMIVRQNKSNVSDINDSIDSMRESGTEVMGVVLNAVETKCIPARTKKTKEKRGN